jgi:hypothetical protein
VTYRRLPYDDAASTLEMAADCAEVDRELRLPPAPRTPFTSLTTADRTESGSLDVSPGLAQMAAGLELHFD